MYETQVINLNKKSCDCNTKKIDLKPQCGTPQCFKIDNYFSELVHNWEKEAARYNLGIQELEGIEYVTENNNGEILTKVVFKYRKGHELFTREFYCAPAGPEGKPGKDGRDGDTGPQGLKGDKGDTPNLGLVRIHWTDKCDEEKGEFKSRCDNPNLYDLELYLRKPDAITELSNILNTINDTLTQYYVTKESLNEKLDLYAKKDWVLQQILNSISNVIDKDSNYTLSYYSPTLKLNKDGKTISTVTIDTSSTSRYVGNITVYQAGTKDHYQQAINNDNNWVSAGWTKSLPVTDSQYPYVWMAVSYINEDSTYQPWTYTRITGINGKDGDSGQGLQGAVIRIKEWKPGTIYYFNAEDVALSDGIYYIDVVLYKGTENIYHYYKCKKTHTSSSTLTPNNTTYWTPAQESDFSYINTLIAENAKISYLDTSEIRVFDNTDTLVAGMTSGNASKIVEDDPLSNGKTSNVRIWAGSSKNSNGYTDLTVAPFRVYQNGDLVANNANITGTFNQNNLTIDNDVILPKDDKIGVMRWLIITDETAHSVIQESGSTNKIKYDNSEYSGLTYSENGLYFIVKVDNTTYRIYKFDQASRAGNCDFKNTIILTDKVCVFENDIMNQSSLTHISDVNDYTFITKQLSVASINEEGKPEDTNRTEFGKWALDYNPEYHQENGVNVSNICLGSVDKPLWNFEFSGTQNYRNSDYKQFKIELLLGVGEGVQNNTKSLTEYIADVTENRPNERVPIYLWIYNNGEWDTYGQLFVIQKETNDNKYTVNFTFSTLNSLNLKYVLPVTYWYEDCADVTPVDHTNDTQVNGGIYNSRGNLVATYENADDTIRITNLTDEVATFKVTDNGEDKFVTLGGKSSGAATATVPEDAEDNYHNTVQPGGSIIP